MAATEYTIEAAQQPGDWFILGSERLSHTAQHRMNAYRRSFPKLPLRVVENPSRIIVVLNDPSPEAA